jgi:hypothetical protein
LKPFAAFSSSSHQHFIRKYASPMPAPPEEEAVSKSEGINLSIAHHCAGRFANIRFTNEAS